jgi:Tol biopolymer transport system component
VKLLDFGLAKAMAAPVQQSGMTSLPTVMGSGQNLTQEGTILGTFQYMAPEQLEGKEADARTDIFAFGALLYEMATGKKAFSGASQASLISSIMTAEPASISAAQPMSPPALDRVVRRCLAKDPEDRWQSAADLGSELQWIGQGSQAGMPAPLAVASRRRIRERLAWIGLAATALAAVLFAAGYFRRAPRPAPPILAALPFPEKMFLAEMALSPDGRTVAFTALKAGGEPSLWIQPLDSREARPVADTADANLPFWSPDSRAVGFFSAGKLKRVDLAGGHVVTVCDAERGVGGTWNRDGAILFAPMPTGALYRVSASGGQPVAVTKLDAGRHETAHRYPQFLPDGRHFLYMAANLAGPPNDPANAIRVGSLDGKDDHSLVPVLSNAAYAAGRLLYVRDGTLLAQPFDDSRLALTGEPAPVAQRLALSSWQSDSIFSASESLLVYAPLYAAPSRLIWVDRNGKPMGTLGEPAIYLRPRISPDGRRIAVDIQDVGKNSTELWLYDVGTGTGTKLAFGAWDDNCPIWSPSGDRVLFGTDRKAKGVRWDLWMKGLDGRAEEPFVESTDQRFPEDWSRDGRFVSFTTIPVQGRRNIQLWALETTEKQVAPVSTEANFQGGSRFSPDGRWIAYASDESGRVEVYVKSFPGSGGKWQVSTAGGTTPEWRGDGKELYYLGLDLKVMAVAVRADSTFQASTPVALFEMQPSQNAFASSFEVASDGQRFLLNASAADQGSPPFDVVVNWLATVEKR